MLNGTCISSQLTLASFEEWAAEMSKVPSFVKERLDPKKLMGLYLAGRAAIEVDPKNPKRIIASSFLFESAHDRVVENGGVFVRDGYRQRDGYGSQPEPLSVKVVAECTRIVLAENLIAVMFTRIKSIAKTARACKWKEDASGGCSIVRFLVRPGSVNPDNVAGKDATWFFFVH